MTATAEKTKPAARRSKVEILTDELELRRGKIEAAKVEIGELGAKADQAASESLKADPSKPACALRTPAYEFNRKRSELEKSVVHLEREALLLEGQLGAAQAEQAVAELADRTKAAKRLAERERELRRQAGEAFAAVVEVWNEFADCLGERSALTAQVVHEHLLERVGIFDRGAREAWEAAAPFVVEPVPIDLRGFLDELLEATTGERPSVEDAESLRGLNRQRAALGLPAELRSVSPTAAALCELYPDLREGLEVAQVSGVAIRRREGAETEGRFGGEAA